MYSLTIVLLMFVLPGSSILLEALFFKSGMGIVPLTGKWFVFWAVGIRLFFAGLRQSVQPRFTAQKVLGIQGNDQFIVVQELGFANISMGLLGIVSVFNEAWIEPSAIVGCLFLGLAGVRHMFTRKRNSLETTAMVSDLFAFVVLFVYLILAGLNVTQ